MSSKLFRLAHSWIWLIALCTSQLRADLPVDQNICTPKTTCRECIQSSFCAWCYQPHEVFEDIPRCFPPAQVSSKVQHCRQEYVYFPSNVIYLLSSLPLSNDIYLTPQRAQVKLLLAQSLSISVYYKAELPLSVELIDNASKYVNIAYYSKCSNEKGPEVFTNKCDNLEIGQVVKYRIELTLRECPENPRERLQTIAITPTNSDETLVINMEMLCSCPCEQPGSRFYEERSPKCSGIGTYNCGTCSCGPMHTGKRCECYKTQSNSTCVSPRSTDNVECSGRGVCICNQCECDGRNDPQESVTGAWCECDNFSCNRHDGQICGGHGECICGECNCKPPWTGSACECHNTAATTCD